MSLGENPSISIWSTQYGFLSVGIDYRGLNFHFNSKTESFVIEEFLSYWNNVYDDKKMYCYQIRNRRKEVIPTFTNDKMITREIIGTFEQYYDKLKITQSTWVYNKLRYRKESLVDGSIQEMAEKHQMGIDSFQCFRYLINKALPFKKDIVKELFPDEIIEQNNLELFFPDYKKKKISTQKVLK